MENSKISPASQTNTFSTSGKGGRNKFSFFNKNDTGQVDGGAQASISGGNSRFRSANNTNTAQRANGTEVKAPKQSAPKRSGGISTKFGQMRSKLLATYYGNPARDMKLICIAGTNGKTTVARFVHDILGSADQQVAIFSSDAPFKASTLHKFLSDAWKAGATHAVITAPAEVISAQAFYGLPLYLVAMTDFSPNTADSAYIADRLDAYASLFYAMPAHVILNRDDPYYKSFADFTGTDSTLTYGTNIASDLRIDTSRLYKLGSEANLLHNHNRFTVASFLTGEPVISCMAGASAIATALHITPAIIAEGISVYDPAES